jgi:MFS family permease
MSTQSDASKPIRPARIGAFTFGIQIVWGAILGVSLQSRVTELSGANAIAVFSTLVATGAAIATIVQVLAGMAADARRARIGHRREFYLWGVVVAVPALVWFYLARSITELAAAFFLLQIALNAATGPYQAAIPDHVPTERRGEASSWMSAWQSLGNAIGLIIVGAISNLRIVAGLLAAALLAAWAVTYAHVRGIATQPSERVAFRLNGVFLTLLFSRGTINLGFFTLLFYLLFFVQQSLGVMGADAVRLQTAMLFLTFTLSAIVGAALAARPSDRFDMRLVATVANAAIIVALATLAPAKQLPVAYAAAALAGAAWGAFFTADWALACALLPRGAMATAMGVWNVATAAPQVFAPILARPLIERYNALAPGLGPRAAIVLSLAEFALGTTLLWLLPATRAARSAAQA